MVKKVLIILVVILLIIGAGVGGYYICKVSMENNNSENSLNDNKNKKNNENQNNKDNNENKNNNTNKDDNKNKTNTSVQEKSNIKIKFSNDECLAVGFIPPGKEEEMYKKCFENQQKENIVKVNNGDAYKFIVIPKDDKIKIKVWSCEIGDDGELYTNNIISEYNKGPILLSTHEFEYIPNVAIECTNEETGIQFLLPITFNGNDGKLSLYGNEDNVLDISIYEMQ